MKTTRFFAFLAAAPALMLCGCASLTGTFETPAVVQREVSAGKLAVAIAVTASPQTAAALELVTPIVLGVLEGIAAAPGAPVPSAAGLQTILLAGIPERYHDAAAGIMALAIDRWDRDVAGQANLAARQAYLKAIIAGLQS